LLVPTPSYFLAKHAFVCLSGGSLVLLDLKRDRYLTLDAARAGALDGVVAGWPVRAAPVPTYDDCAGQIVASMIKRGLLTSERLEGKEPVPPQVAAPADAVLDATQGRDARVRLRHVADFVHALALAAWHLRFRSMEWIVADVARRRAQLRVGRSDSDRAIRQLARVFDRLRSVTYDVSDASLFDSLALLYFLLGQGLQPQWVIGVRSSPELVAHSWLQHRGTVLNDSVDRVSVYTPIMAA
jgi:hypothetical protein